MTSISGLRWGMGERTVGWECDGVRVERSFERPLTGVVAWDDPPCVIVVEDMVAGGRLDNAVVLAPDGSERLRLIPPDVADVAGAGREPLSGLGFYTIYVSNGVLTAVFSTRTGDLWGRPDLKSGRLIGVARWR